MNPIRMEPCVLSILLAPVAAAQFLEPDVEAPHTFTGVNPCPADPAQPFGAQDFSDVLAFLSAFGASCS